MTEEEKIFEGTITVKSFETKLIKMFGVEKLRKEKYSEKDDTKEDACIRMYLYKVDTGQANLDRLCHVATYLRDEKRGWIFPKEQIERMSNNTIKIKEIKE